MDGDILRDKFNFGGFGSIGLEEEVWLVDENGTMAPKALDVLMLAARELRLNPDDWDNLIYDSAVLSLAAYRDLDIIKRRLHLQPELPSQQLELTTPVAYSPAEAVENLLARREHLADLADNCGCQLSFESAPDFDFGDVRIFPLARYLRIADICGHNIVNGHIAALHVHVGLADERQALRVYNHVRKPLFEEFKFAFSRKRIEKYLALSGVGNFCPPPLCDWPRFAALLKDIGAFEDPTRCWWALRLNPQGTIELRLPDTTEDPEKIEKIIDLFLRLVREAA